MDGRSLVMDLETGVTPSSNADARAANCLAVYVDELLRLGLRGANERKVGREEGVGSGHCHLSLFVRGLLQKPPEEAERHSKHVTQLWDETSSFI